MKDPSQKKDSTADLIVPAGLFIGLGIGLITGEVAGYTILGFGIGFLGMFGAKVFIKRK